MLHDREWKIALKAMIRYQDINYMKQARKGYQPLSAIFVIIFFGIWGEFFGISLEFSGGFFWRIFLTEFFGGIFWEKYFMRIFFDGIFLVEFFGRKFLGGLSLGGFFGRILL